MPSLGGRATNRRIVSALLAALLLALWAFVGYWSWSQRRGALTAATANLEQLTSAVDEQVMRLLKQTETSLAVATHWMAEHPTEDPGESASFIALVDRLRLLSGDVMDIRMVSRSGGLHYIPKRDRKPLADVSDRDYFRAQFNAATRGFFVADPVVSRVTGKWGLPISVPAEPAGGDIAVLFAALELDRLTPIFEAERVKPLGSVAITRTDGTYMFRTPMDEKSIGISITQTPDWKEHFSQRPRGVFRSESPFTDHRRRLVSFSRLKDYPLIIIVTATEEELLAPWRRETGTLVSIATAVTMVSLLLGAFLLRAMRAEETAQRATERAHREAQLILSSAGEGICGVDPTGRVSFINPAARRMLGWENSDPVGVMLHAATHHSHPDGTAYPETECPVRLTLNDGETREARHETFWRRDGVSFPVEFVVTGAVEDGIVKGAVLVFRDISDRIEAGRALQANTRDLERSNAELEQFAFIASHDLREPLRQVSSYVTLLERRYGALLQDDGREFIRYARDGAKRMDQLIIDLLEFSRIGHHSLPVEAIDLTDTVDDVISNLTRGIVEAGAVVYRVDELPRVRAIRQEMIRLFQNLIGNALKYRDPFRTPVIRISARLEEGEWVITVSDNGIGIAPDYSEKVFGIFQRLHTRDRFEGTGIGLAICKKIVECQGGRIWLDSLPGEGADFHVALPVIA